MAGTGVLPFIRGIDLTLNDLEDEKLKVRTQMDLFIDLGAPCLVYGETAGTIQNIRNAPLNSRRILSDEEFKKYGE